MKKLFLLSFLLGLWSQAFANDINYVGLSPYYTDNDAERVKTIILNHLLSGASPESVWTIHDAQNLQAIVNITIPKLAFDGPDARAEAMQESLGVLVDWFAHRPQASATLQGTAAIRFPQYCDFLASRRAPGPVILWVFASPFYLAPEIPGFLMTESRYPSDGHLSAHRAESVFSLEGRQQQLRDVTIRWNFLNGSIWVNDNHRKATTRWLSLLISGQMGRLLTFDASLPDMFTANPVTAPSFTIDPEDTKVIMRQAVSPAVPQASQSAVAPSPQAQTTVPAPPLHSDSSPAPNSINTTQKAKFGVTAPTLAPLVYPNTASLPTPGPTRLPAPATQKSPAPDEIPQPAPVMTPEPAPVTQGLPQAPAVLMGLKLPEPSRVVKPSPIVLPLEIDQQASAIGVIWHSQNDVDLNLRIKPDISAKDPGELYFRRKANALGKYLHDFRSGGVDYEWIELASNLDVRNLAANYEIWCDNYSGRGPVGITAVIADHGKITATRDLTIQGNGDRRNDTRTREHSLNWVRVPIEEMIGPDR